MGKVKSFFKSKDAPVYFIFCYARSGGTLLNRCLANIKDLIVLSEVHPINDFVDRVETVSIAWQAQKWYGIKLNSAGYLSQIKELKEWCDCHGKFLLIRDWSFIDFTPNPMNDYKPRNELSGYHILKNNFDLHSVAFVRDAIDVALSRGGNLEEFSDAYSNYIEFLCSEMVEIFKYECFCEQPDKAFCEIGKSLRIPGHENWVVSLQNYNVTGDVNPSRGNQKVKVEKLKRKYAFPLKRKALNNNQKISKVNIRLGYSPRYESCESEEFFNMLFFLIKRKVKRMKQR